MTAKIGPREAALRAAREQQFIPPPKREMRTPRARAGGTAKTTKRKTKR